MPQAEESVARKGGVCADGGGGFRRRGECRRVQARRVPASRRGGGGRRHVGGGRRHAPGGGECGGRARVSGGKDSSWGVGTLRGFFFGFSYRVNKTNKKAIKGVWCRPLTKQRADTRLTPCR